MTSLLQTKSLTVSIADNLVCRDLDFTVDTGDKWGILGVNGVGKTTLLHTLAGLHQPDRGEILYSGKPLIEISSRQRAQHRGVLFQEKSDPFPATVLESVLTGRHPYIDHWQWETKQDFDIARKSLVQVELQDRERQLVGTLSGGERQRVAIATLLTQQTKVLLLDEPTNNLDLKRQMKIMEIFSQSIRTKDSAAVMILHDLNIASRYCNKILLLFGNGKSMQGSHSEMLTDERLSELYGYPIDIIYKEKTAVFVPR